MTSPRPHDLQLTAAAGRAAAPEAVREILSNTKTTLRQAAAGWFVLGAGQEEYGSFVQAAAHRRRFGEGGPVLPDGQGREIV